MTSTSIRSALRIFVRHNKAFTLRGPQSVLSGPIVPTAPIPQPPTMGPAGPGSAPIIPTPEAAKDPRNRPYGHNNAALRSEFYYVTFQDHAPSPLKHTAPDTLLPTRNPATWYAPALNILHNTPYSSTYTDLFSWVDLMEPALAIDADLLQWAKLPPQGKQQALTTHTRRLRALMDAGLRVGAVRETHATGTVNLNLSAYKRQGYSFAEWAENMASGSAHIPLPLIVAILNAHPDFTTPQQVILHLQAQVRVSEL